MLTIDYSRARRLVRQKISRRGLSRRPPNLRRTALRTQSPSILSLDFVKLLHMLAAVEAFHPVVLTQPLRTPNFQQEAKAYWVLVSNPTT